MLKPETVVNAVIEVASKSKAGKRMLEMLLLLVLNLAAGWGYEHGPEIARIFCEVVMALSIVPFMFLFIGLLTAIMDDVPRK
jgi:hypothetical protein